MSEAGDATRRALLDAAEELLVSSGLSEITTRKVADKAGVNQALIHYHFGTIEELLIAVLERVSHSVKARAEEIYSRKELFLNAWFREMDAMTGSDFERGWGKIWLENLTLAANRPAIRKQYVKASNTVRKLHEQQVGQMLDQLGLDRSEYPPQAVVTLLDAITSKIILDRLVGIRRGHADLVPMLRRIWDDLIPSTRPG